MEFEWNMVVYQVVARMGLKSVTRIWYGLLGSLLLPLWKGGGVYVDFIWRGLESYWWGLSRLYWRYNKSQITVVLQCGIAGWFYFFEMPFVSSLFISQSTQPKSLLAVRHKHLQGFFVIFSVYWNINLCSWCPCNFLGEVFCIRRMIVLRGVLTLAHSPWDCGFK